MTDLPLVSVLEASAAAEARGSSPFAELSGLDLARVLAASGAHGDRAWLLARIGGARRLKGWCEAIEQDTLLALAGVVEQVRLHEVDGRAVPVCDEVVADVALATARSEADVRKQLTTARVLEQALPEVKTALAEGRVDAEKATVLAQAAERLPAALYAPYQAGMLARAEQEPLREFKGSSEQAIRDLDPEGKAERQQRAARRRAVWLSPDVDGNAIFSARLAALDAHACLRRVEDEVRGQRDAVVAEYAAQGMEPPTTGMLQAEAFLAMFWSGSESGANSASRTSDSSGAASLDRASHRPVHAEVQVQVDLRTLAGLAEGAVIIDGRTTTDMDALREFLARCDDIAFRRLITDPDTGAVIDCGRKSYLAPAPLRRFITARDGHCVWPGCLESAVHCDIDHAQPWDDGGGTDAANLNALCRHHHLLKTAEGYRLERRDDTWVVITPGGQQVATARAGPRRAHAGGQAQAPPDQ